MMISLRHIALFLLTSSICFASKPEPVDPNQFAPQPPATAGTWRVENNQVTFRPTEFPGALKNPMMGLYGREYMFTNGLETVGNRQWASTYRGLIGWNWLERNAEVSEARIHEVLNDIWQGFPAGNAKVIPRIYLEWPHATKFDHLKYVFGGPHWPEDLEVQDYKSPAFDERISRLIERLAPIWDNDPRVAFIQTGIYGRWGEQHSPDANQELISNTYGRLFKNKKVLVRYLHKWDVPGFEPGAYHDSFASTKETQELAEFVARTERWKAAPIMGEVAYDYGDKDFVGRNPNESMLGKSPYYIINAARWCHMSGLCWLGDYGPYQIQSSTDKPPVFTMEWAWKYLTDPALQKEIIQGAELIQKNLGYRFVMQEATFPASVAPGGRLPVMFRVRNDGSAPFYYDWKVQAALLGPDNKPVWTGIFDQTDIRKWLPGHGLDGAVYPFPESWGEAVQPYLTPPEVITENATFTLPSTIPPGVYTLALSILDPGGNLPSMRFANWNYLEGGFHPIGRLSIGVPVKDSSLGADAVRSPARDQSLFYKL